MMTVSDIESTSLRWSQDLSGPPADRNRLLDMATAINLIAGEVRRAADTEVAGKPEVFLVRTALSKVDSCISWVQWYGQTAPAGDVREKVVSAGQSAEQALALLHTAGA
jgi:hypothetical protein